MAYTERVVILVDMDCFYCQVEEKLDRNLTGKPIAVVQYNAWRGGGIIAVNYPAREKGVTRHMRGDEAKQKCPEIVLARVPEVRGKADLTKYREAGKRVAEVLQTFTTLLERASVDEAYLDITDAVNKRINQDFEEICIENMQNTYVVGQDTKDFLYNIHNDKIYSESNCKLAMGGLIAEEIRADVYKKTGYKCSAGIAHNKVLAKLVCGLHKPNKQTIIPQECVPALYKDLPLRKVKSLGGKFGGVLSEELKISTMGELIQFSEKDLAKRFDEKTSNWLYNIARGIDIEPVTVRLVSKSIGCCKKFPGRNALITSESVEHWMSELASEISERLLKDLEENNRRAKQMVISFAQEINKKDVSSSRTLSLNSYDQAKIAQRGFDTIKKFCLKADGSYKLKFLGISVGNFEENNKVNITTFFKNMKSKNLKKCSLPNKEETSSPITQILKETQLSHENLGNKKVYINSKDKTTTNFSTNSLSSINGINKSISDNNHNLSDLKIETSSEEKSCDDDGNASIYSATTEELNEDTKSLIYYEDIYPESLASQPIFEKKSVDMSMYCNVTNSNGLEDFILSDNSNSSNDMYGIRNSPNSFFTRYFENTTEGSNFSPVNRNFDTSKILEENEMEYSIENINTDEICTQNMEDIQEINKMVNSQDETKEQKRETLYGQFDFRETCPECSKEILSYELVTHMDYHYALKMVRDEAHLYKPTQNIVVQNQAKIERNPIRQTKRKSDRDPKETKPILAYFQKEDVNEENGELCSECQKNIKFEDIANHIDFHAAKKLHLEINSYSSSTSSKPDKSSNKTKVKNKDITALRNVSHFFKPS